MATRKIKTGRPPMYSDALAKKICDLIEEGYSERQIAEMPEMPSRETLRKWKEENRDFLDRSVRAREASAERFDDERIERVEWLSTLIDQSARAGAPIPKGIVEGAKVVMQELARSAALRDDSRFGDRKTVKVDTKTDGAGLADVYAKIAEAVGSGNSEEK